MIRIIFCLGILSGLAGPTLAEVIISEIMYNPDGNDAQVGEWVEVFNSGSVAVDLSGWTFEDVQDGQVASPIPNGTSLAPGQALVLTGNVASFDSQWNPSGFGVNRIGLSSFPTLANSPSSTNETVALRNSQGVLVDTVNYDDEGPWPTDSPDGSSISLLPVALSEAGNNGGGSWIPSMFGVYGARFEFGTTGTQDRASPGFVETVPQGPFEPSHDVAWSMVVLPDTQAYAKSSVNRHVFTQMTQWIADNRDDFGIQFVLHEGDIVNQNSQVTPTSGDQSGDEQWQNAKASMSVLDGVVPYAFSPGNHDYGPTNAQNRSTQFNDFFKFTDNPLVSPAQGGTLHSLYDSSELDNSIHRFTAPDGREMVILTTEWGPRQQIVDWANDTLSQPQYAGTTAILLTHAYMYHDETRLNWARNLDGNPNNNQGGNPHSYPTAPDTHDGEDLWQELVSPNPIFEMVFSGHIGSDGVGYLASTGDEGQTVHQMLFDTQFETNGGNGWLRVVEFLENGRDVRIRTYSPLYELQKTDPANFFEFSISPIIPLLSGDYNDDGTVDAADYGVWLANLGGPEGSLTNDADGGTIGVAQYNTWKANLGSTLSSSTAPAEAAVPELSSLVVLSLALMLLVYSRREC